MAYQPEACFVSPSEYLREFCSIPRKHSDTLLVEKYDATKWSAEAGLSRLLCRICFPTADEAAVLLHKGPAMSKLPISWAQFGFVAGPDFLEAALRYPDRVLCSKYL